MAEINLNLILGECVDFAGTSSGSDVVNEEILHEVFGGTTGRQSKKNKKRGTAEQLQQIARMFVKYMERVADNEFAISESVLENIGDAIISDVYNGRGSKLCVNIDFGGDLTRPSLQPEKYKKGIKNIVAVISTGYKKNQKMKYVAGNWHGQFTHALTKRDPQFFIQEAASQFMEKYADKYAVEIEIGQAYGYTPIW